MMEERQTPFEPNDHAVSMIMNFVRSVVLHKTRDLEDLERTNGKTVADLVRSRLIEIHNELGDTTNLDFITLKKEDK